MNKYIIDRMKRHYNLDYKRYYRAMLTIHESKLLSCKVIFKAHVSRKCQRVNLGFARCVLVTIVLQECDN